MSNGTLLDILYKKTDYFRMLLAVRAVSRDCHTSDADFEKLLGAHEGLAGFVRRSRKDRAANGLPLD
jgi:hypothetical protein